MTVHRITVKNWVGKMTKLGTLPHNHDLAKNILVKLRQSKKETYLVESRVLKAVEPGEAGSALPVAGAPESDAITLHYVVRTPRRGVTVRLLVRSQRGVVFIAQRGGRRAHNSVAPGKAGNVSAITQIRTHAPDVPASVAVAR